jgi:hypothetical protein
LEFKLQLAPFQRFMPSRGSADLTTCVGFIVFFLLAKTGKDWQKLAKSMVYDESLETGLWHPAVFWWYS